MNATLGYPRNQKGDIDVLNKRSGHSKKTLKSQFGESQITSQGIETVSLNLNAFPSTSGMFLVLKSR